MTLGKIPVFVELAYNTSEAPGLFRLCKDKAELLTECVPGTHIWFRSLSGDARRALVTSVKTWKRDPGRLEIRLKYGMYEYSKFELREALDRVLIRIRDATNKDLMMALIEERKRR